MSHLALRTALIPLVFLATSSACISSDAVECANGLLCPAGSLCDLQRNRCITPEQIQACLDLEALSPCEYPGSSPDARCLAGVCTTPRCGDGAVEDNEACDDNNTVPGDGCDATCQIEPEYTCELEPSICRIPLTQDFAQGGIRDVDLLFVVDNSGTMAFVQQELQALFPAAVATLRGLVEGLPSLHVGVTSTDLGTGMFQITYCEEVGGDGGNLLTGNCNGINGAPFVIDVEPQGCEIGRTELGVCQSDCTQAHCDATEDRPTTLVTDMLGCPRCLNYTGQLEEIVGCMTALGTMGCGFEQPLEAMTRALYDNPNNDGFLREGALLAVVIVTDEDDCSASDPDLFSNTQTDINSELGPLTSYRCHEFGITCDNNERTHTGLRQECRPRQDPGAKLYPISRYVDFLEWLKDPARLVVAAIGGPAADHSVVVQLDEQDNPQVQFSCTYGDAGAVPGVRIRALVERFHGGEDTDRAYQSICVDNLQSSLDGITQLIGARVSNCLPAPLKGCPDPGASMGPMGDGQPCNDACVPSCQVTERQQPGSPWEIVTAIPWCREVCTTGVCPGNTDATLAYKGGHPDPIDPALPLPACWHIEYSSNCFDSNFARLAMSRVQPAPERSTVAVDCDGLPSVESACEDGVDNDEDCLVDADDPDCPQPY